MQKTLAFLEQNVQWVALAIAAVFFGFCVWSFVITPPAEQASKGGKEPFTPQNVDETIANGPVQEIKRSIESTTAGGQDLVINVPDVVKPWQAQMNRETRTAIAQDVFRPLYMPGVIHDPRTPQVPGGPGGLIADLPVLAKATPQTPASGLSVVSVPAPAQGGAAQAVAAQNFDLPWVTVSGVLAAKDEQASFQAIQDILDKALARQNRPPLPIDTAILKVELQRQRGIWGPNGPVFPDGDKGVEVVPPTKLDQANPHPLPDANAPMAEKVTFYQWAEKNPELVYQPKFFDVHGGTPWVQPALGGAAAAPAPAAGAPKPLAGVPPVMPKVQPNQPAPGVVGGAAAGPGGKNPGQIAVANLNQDILVWNHDDSVQAGQTYRYRIVYYMKNPLIGLQNVAHPSIVEKLYVQSPPSDWSAPVTIAKVTQFWFAGLRGGGAAADVYIWQNGAWTKKTNQVFNPGDRVADSEWTVIDVHGQTPGSRDREKYVILTNDAGDIMRRFPGVDRFSDERKALDALVNPGAAAGAQPPPANNPPPRPTGTGARAGVMPKGGG